MIYNTKNSELHLNPKFEQSFSTVRFSVRRFGFYLDKATGTGDEWACIVLVSDGISSILSDQEIVDLVRGAPDPKAGANRILAFSQELGGDDNATAIVIPLIGWGKVDGPDKTKGLREYRQRQIRKCCSDYTYI